MSPTVMPSPEQPCTGSRQSGFSLVELMIAITLSLIILAALSAIFVTSSRARDEIARANQQIENGRYAMQILSDDLQLAGYYGGFIPGSVPMAIPGALPDCSAAVADVEAAIPLHIQGYDNGTGLPTACNTALSGRKAGTDVVLVRRVSTCVADDADATCPDDAGELYFQASQCNAELATATKYRLSTSTNAATFDRHRRGSDCATAPLADKRRFITHVYYIANNNEAGDGVPTLKRAELRNGSFTTITPLAEGIEQLELEYGIDTSGDGAPDGSYSSSPADPGEWANVMAVEINLLARSTDPSPGHVDSKTYVLGADSFTPAGSYKRHVFQTTVRLSNPAGLRQQ